MNTLYYQLVTLALIGLSLAGTAQQAIQIDLSGKKQFELGEPIILYAQIRNNTDSAIGLCREWSDFSVYSITHSLPGDSLLHDPLTGQFIREVYSHTITPKIDGVYEVRNRTCPVSSNSALMIEPGKTLYYPLLISECWGINNDGCKGKYRYLLPKGIYHFQADFSFSNGQLFRGRYEFEIIGTSPDFQEQLMEYTPLLDTFLVHHYFGDAHVKDKKYDAAVSDPYYEYLLKSADNRIVSKALIQLSKISGTEWMVFWYFRVLEKADDLLLYYLLNEFVAEDFFLYKDKAEVLRIYDKLLQSLKKRDRVFSEYLLERLRTKLRYSDHGRYSQEKFPINEADLEGLKIYSAKKK